jgi:hypothetical protein
MEITKNKNPQASLQIVYRFFSSIFVAQDGVLCAKEIYRLGHMDFKIYTLAKNPWP